MVTCCFHFKTVYYVDCGLWSTDDDSKILHLKIFENLEIVTKTLIHCSTSSVNASSSSFAPVWALLKKIGVLYSSLTHSVCTSFHYKNNLNISWYSLIPHLPLLLCCRKQIENWLNQLLLFLSFHNTYQHSFLPPPSHFLFKTSPIFIPNPLTPFKEK